MDLKKIFTTLTLSFLLTSLLISQDRELLGAGATFPYVLYSKMFDDYYKKTGIKVNYQSIGSGGGIRQLKEKTVDFGASDAFLSEAQLREFDSPVIHIPICLGAVVITYNLPGNPELKLTPDVIADIYLGKIKKWNDPKLVSLNPDVKLPNMNITVIHRSDGSGTTFVFVDYLSKVSKEWETKVGRGTSVAWPVGLGGKGNEGVTGLVKQIPGSIGYVELIYAKQNKLPVALIKNKKGKFIKPELFSITSSAKVDIPSDTRVSVTDTDAEDGYPISSFTWILIYKEQNYKNRSLERAKQLVKLLWWMIHEGQAHTEPLDYAKLPPEVVKKAEALIKTITYNGKPVYKEVGIK
ncbi:phosphate ABC transporter substrate-binding protein, PhoT family (TC 3.A.1.7.1) [Candidatus Kryptobacter tengchongensis]|uniref:Phosphate-binding protein n=1 Tax=Kryptobacter tengchongensis TaxID=1643429 RepID=A0A656D445_KRYT1|nr:phosphate ABC transporter substrate-binding protein PstS [Candidatus Kryptobacter tengchongensis]CUS96813.1 phosphate ABC transporter substrate-binding protein, PhoT family (TC 3.A.1.7.1) [Candidatus Kryptobacter tengchongensis]CUU01327.1 phosphate ABC transporter substrate-binding protein, PhoT family (TC 3.A.1.7.1) [Candidatus Kryptobacter tengchongensis]